MSTHALVRQRCVCCVCVQVQVQVQVQILTKRDALVCVCVVCVCVFLCVCAQVQILTTRDAQGYQPLALLLLYYCFTTKPLRVALTKRDALLLLYCCFTAALLLNLCVWL
jgi:hypothetical protein